MLQKPIRLAVASRVLRNAFLGGFTALLALQVPASAADLTAYTTEWAPYNFEEDQVIKGVSSDLLNEACNLAKLKCEIQMVPWARGYKITQNTPNTLIYTTARKPSRENEFLWVGPILPRVTWIYTSVVGDRQPKSLQELGQWRIGVVRGEAAQQDLLSAGVPASSLVEANSNHDLMRMVQARMIDALVNTEVGMQWQLRTFQGGTISLHRTLKLSDEGAYYYALNRQSDPEHVRKLQTSIDKIRRSGRLDAIVRSYGSTASAEK